MMTSFIDLDNVWRQSRLSLLVLVVLIAIYQVLRWHADRKVDDREPPIVSSPIPYVGHILGIAIFGARYLRIARTKSVDPIFTLPLLNSRMYIVADPALAANVQKSPKTLSFTPLIPEATTRILGFDEETSMITKKGLENYGSNPGIIPETHDLIYTKLAPGESLDELTSTGISEINKEVHHFSQTVINAGNDEVKQDLLAWSKHIISLVSARALYGPKNPLDVNPALIESFWDFDHGLAGLLLAVVPAFTARKAYQGREAMADALKSYLLEERHKFGSKLIQRRIQICEAHGLKPSMTARCELSFLFAGIANTAVTVFWLILHIISRPSVLEAILRELEAAGEGSNQESHRRVISIQNIKDRCPMFQSVYRETLRTGSENSATRLVTTDTILADRYFLKKDAVLQISGGIIHNEKVVWGHDASEFRPDRFMKAGDTKGNWKSPNSASDEAATAPSQVHPAAFRSFGGGATLCPGRHFANSEILGLAGLVLLTFDIQPIAGEKLQIPRKKDNDLAIHILEPVEDVEVTFKLKESCRLAPWSLTA